MFFSPPAGTGLLKSADGALALASAGDLPAHTHDLADITDAGTVAAVDLTGNASEFLKGDGTWGAGGAGLTAADVVDLLYPVGAIYVSTLSTNPGTLFGVGTWAAFGAGRTLVGIDSGDTDFDTVEELAGAKTKAISAHAGTAVADHASHTHGVTSNVAVADHASHTHGVTPNVAVADHASHTHDIASSIATPDLFTSSGAGSAVSGRTGGPSATLTHAVTNNPVTSGGPSATLSHSVTNNAVTSAGPSATLSHSVTQPNAHSDLNVVQPSIVVYMFKRTA